MDFVVPYIESGNYLYNSFDYFDCIVSGDFDVIEPIDLDFNNFFTSVEGGSFTPEQACGILGNLHVENGVNLNDKKDFDPGLNPVKEPDGALAYGLAQWNDADRAANVKGGLSRYAELVDFSAKNGYNWRTMFAQLQFIKYELFRYSFLGLNKLQRANTVDEAALIFEKKYLRPAPGSTEKRQEEARNYFEEMV